LKRFQPVHQSWKSQGLQIIQNRSLTLPKINLIPIINAGENQRIPFDLHTTSAIDIVTGRLIEQTFTVLGGERFGLQILTAVAGAIHGVMNAVILPDRSQDAVFDIVQ